MIGSVPTWHLAVHFFSVERSRETIPTRLSLYTCFYGITASSLLVYARIAPTNHAVLDNFRHVAVHGRSCTCLCMICNVSHSGLVDELGCVRTVVFSHGSRAKGSTRFKRGLTDPAQLSTESDTTRHTPRSPNVSGNSKCLTR